MGCGASTPVKDGAGRSAGSTTASGHAKARSQGAEATKRNEFDIGPNYKPVKHLGEWRGSGRSGGGGERGPARGLARLRWERVQGMGPRRACPELCWSVACRCLCRPGRHR